MAIFTKKNGLINEIAAKKGPLSIVNSIERNKALLLNKAAFCWLMLQIHLITLKCAKLLTVQISTGTPGFPPLNFTQ